MFHNSSMRQLNSHWMSVHLSPTIWFFSGTWGDYRIYILHNNARHRHPLCGEIIALDFSESEEESSGWVALLFLFSVTKTWFFPFFFWFYKNNSKKGNFLDGLTPSDSDLQFISQTSILQSFRFKSDCNPTDPIPIDRDRLQIPITRLKELAGNSRSIRIAQAICQIWNTS